MKIMLLDLISNLRSTGIQLWCKKGKLHLDGDLQAVPSVLRDTLNRCEDEILAALLLALDGDMSEISQALRANAVPVDPLGSHSDEMLSAQQRRSWILHKIEPGRSVDNMVFGTRMRGRLDVNVLQRSLNNILVQNDILHSSFPGRGSIPSQVILNVSDVPIRQRSCFSSSEAEALRISMKAAKEERRLPFDLAHDIPIRFTLLGTGEGEYTFLMSVHRITFDRESWHVFLRELGDNYRACMKDLDLETGTPIQYADFAQWQNRLLDDTQTGLRGTQLDYWSGRLSGDLPLAEAPFDHPRSALLECEMAQEAFAFPKSLKHGLMKLAEEEKVSFFTPLLVAFQTLFARYSGQPQVTVGCPISYRTRPELRDVIGPLENSLVMRNEIDGNLSFRALIDQTRAIVCQAFAHQDLPFSEVLDAIQPSPHLNRHPLFQVTFSFESAPPVPFELLGLIVEPIELASNMAEVDLALRIWEGNDSLQGALEYNESLFESTTVDRILNHWRAFLVGVIANPDRPVSEISLLSESERKQALVQWNDTGRDYPVERHPHKMMEARVVKTPDEIAVVFGEQRLTYDELNARANRLAHYLRELGIGPDTVVGICLGRSLDMVTALLAILKAGGAYLPLDTSYPKERLAFMLSDSKTKVLLTNREIADLLPESDARVVRLDDEWESISERSKENPSLTITPDNLIYVIYTSGSTGTPKGVAMVQRAMTNLINWQLEYSPATVGSKTLQFSPLSFDVSFQEIFSTWASSGTLVMISNDMRLDPPSLLRYIKQNAVERLFAPFVVLQNLVEAALDRDSAPECLREIITAGEQLQVNQHVIDFFFRMPMCKLYNHYGPTEAHVTTAHMLKGTPDSWPALPPIGRPIWNVQNYILNTQMEPVAIGETGEIWLGGECLARGYLHRDDLTAERFAPNPFLEDQDARIYKTGDMGRYRPDGSIEYLSRLDGQVKISGYRVEIGEIEVALAQRPDVSQVAVVVREDEPGDKRIVAYIVPRKSQPLSADKLREVLRKSLPVYMIPSAFVTLKALPRTPSGKVDRRSLPAPSGLRPEMEQGYVSPKNELEQKIAEIWRQVLNLQQVGVEDTFFNLGGNSLMTLKVAARLNQVHGIDIPVVRLFEYPTISALADFLSREQSDASPRDAIRKRMERRFSNDSARSEAVAIIGIAGRFPGAANVGELWKNLCAGTDSITFFKDHELDPGIDPKNRNNPQYIKARGVIEHAQEFDAAFFDIRPREAEVMDPQQRLFLETAWEALESAGLDPDTYSGLVGVYAGTGNNTYFQTHVSAHPDIVEKVGPFQAMTSNEKDYVATRVSHKLNLRGPSLSIHTACSTSLVAIASACQALTAHHCDVALAGGASVTAPVWSGYLYEEGSMLSADGHCRPFDENAKGTTFNDGVGVVVLKRLSDAIADGDHVHAVIRGVGINNDGADKVSFTAPSVEGQALAIAMAQADAGVEPESISYVETHGTGTPLGDPIEIEALTRAFQTESGMKQYCAIGSIKSNIGHLTAAAGVAGLIKTALALEHRKIPPTVHFQKPNPKIDFENSPFYVCDELTEWKSDTGTRRAGVSSFGVGGTNAHVILEEALEPEPSSPSRPRQLLTLSARSRSALDEATSRLAKHLRDYPEINIADAAFTLQTGRRAFQHRRILACNDATDAVEALELPGPPRVSAREAKGRRPDVAFMFPGQGAQYVSMGANLYATEPLFRETVDQCSAILKPLLGRDLREVLYPAEGDEETAAISLRETLYTQPALFTIEYALAQLWMSWGIRPVALIGHSIGEYTAACLAGVFGVEDALTLVANRGRLMQELPSGSMLSVRLPVQEIKSRLGSDCSVAAANGPKLSVVSGPDESIAKLQAELEGANIICRHLHTSHAFHSAMMDPIVEPFAKHVEKVRLSPPEIPILSTLTADWLTPEQATDPMYWAKHLRQMVRFSDGIQKIWENPELLLLEVGPRTTATTLALQQVTDSKTQIAISSLSDNSENQAEWVSLLQAIGQLWLAGASVDWNCFYDRETRKRIPLPTYPFERKRYWLEPAAQIPPTTDPPIQSNRQPQAHLTPEAQPAMVQTSRKDRLVHLLKETLEESSGDEMENVEESTTFFEMGLDSLFLTQIAQTFKKKFNVTITFRQLMEEFPSLGLLADYLDRELPPDAVAEPVVPSAPIPSVIGEGASPPPSGDIRQLMAQQVHLMAQQLRLLGGDSSSLTGDFLPMKKAVVTPAQTKTVCQPVPERQGDEAAPANKKTFGAGTRISTTGGDDLTPRERKNLSEFIERYTAKTNGSKQSTQANRQQLADPRVVSGFRPALKELVYPIVFERARGSKLWDIDGNEYVDLTCGFGSCFLGYSPDFVNDALHKQMEKGYPIGPQTTSAGAAAKLICELTGHERVAFCNTGSEAVLGASRLARTVTGRDLVVMFSGSYHGILDEVIVRGSKSLRSFPAAAGIPRSAVQNTLILDYGTPESLEIIRARADELAAVLVEPVQSRRPDFQPVDFLKEIRSITEQSGTAFIFDEVITGFRTHPAGAQGLFGIKADIGTYGKAFAGGMPIGVIAGKAQYMDAFDGGFWEFGDDSFPEVGVTYFAGTFVRHPLTMAATQAVLEYIKSEGPSLQTGLNERTTVLVNDLNAHFENENAPLRISHFSSMFKVQFTREEPYGELLYCYLREKGVHIWDARPCFLTTAHTDEDLALIVQAFKDSIAQMSAAGFLAGGAGGAVPETPVANKPPTPDARLGRDPEGNPAWFAPDPARPGKYLQVGVSS